MLQRYDFTSGAVRCWIGPDSSVVTVRLYQFGSVQNAHGFFADDIETTSGDYTPANRTRIDSVPRAWEYSDPKRDTQGFVHVIAIGVKGDVVFVASVAEFSHTISLTLPSRLMHRQYRKL